MPIVDRTFDFSKTLFDLDAPDTHRVTVTHEYIESQQGGRSHIALLDRITLSSLAVTDVDTGDALKTEQDKGGTFAVLAAPITKPGLTARVRVAGTLTDPAYAVANGELAWAQTTKTPRTTVLLPATWEVTSVSVPATVSTQPDGRVVVQVYDGRADDGLPIAIRAVQKR